MGAASAEAHVHQVVAKGRFHFRGAMIDCEVDPAMVKGSRVGDFKAASTSTRGIGWAQVASSLSHRVTECGVTLPGATRRPEEAQELHSGTAKGGV